MPEPGVASTFSHGNFIGASRRPIDIDFASREDEVGRVGDWEGT